MPCIEDWLSKPLLIVDSITAEDSDSQIQQVKEYFTQRLKDQGLDRVPSLNERYLDSLGPNTLVRFRCMIQDVFEPEYYLSTYETIEKSSLEKGVNVGMYRDVASCKPGCDIDLNSPKNVTKERLCFYCVPIPGETAWAKHAYATASGVQCNNDSNDIKAAASQKSLKRDHSDIEQNNEGLSSSSCDVKNDTKRVKDGVDAPKKISTALEDLDLNLPLSDGNGPACIVKVYSDSDTFKVNEIVEFVGVLSVDPILTEFDNQRDDSECPSLDMEIDEHNPLSLPSSLVPRVHAVASYKLQHSNPLVDVNFNPSASESLFSDMSRVHESLLNVFEQLLYGDSVAAQYLLLHLLSTVYSTPDGLALGKYTLNIIGCSKEVAEQVSEIIKVIVPKCHKFPMTISNLNQSKLVPKKDYTANRLISGKLQLTDGTHLILDETALEEGKLDTNGVQNIAALNHVIQWQKVQYDFTYYKTDFTSNIVILVLSEGKSLLQADSRVRVEAKIPPVRLANIAQFSPDFVDNVRKYLTMARLVSYEIPADVKKHIEEDFVQMRQDAPGEMTVQCFHSLLSLARLMAISSGRQNLSQEDWVKSKELEKLRLCRLPQDNQ